MKAGPELAIQALLEDIVTNHLEVAVAIEKCNIKVVQKGDRRPHLTWCKCIMSHRTWNVCRS